MRIFVTGVAGFLGSHVSKKMIDLGHKVSGNDNLIGGDYANIPEGVVFHKCDCLDYNNMKKITENHDIVFHSAATAHEGFSVFSPNIITKNIFQATVSTISAVISNNIKRFIFCSSMARYGSQNIPFKEEMTPSPQDPYGIAKVAAENILKVLSEVHGMEYNIVVPHNIVGPNQKYDDPFRNVMSIFINRNLQGKPAIIYGDGNQKRCFSYIDDVINCLEKIILDRNINKEIINVGPDEETITLNELAKLVANETGCNQKPVHVLERPLEVKYATCSSEKARRLLKYKTKTTTKEAVVKTTDFIKERGVKPFKYYLPLEINNEKTPDTWKKKLI